MYMELKNQVGQSEQSMHVFCMPVSHCKPQLLLKKVEQSSLRFKKGAIWEGGSLALKLIGSLRLEGTMKLLQLVRTLIVHKVIIIIFFVKRFSTTQGH